MMGRVAATLWVLGMAAAAFATDAAHTLPGVKLNPPPVIDGVVDTKVEWAKAPTGSGSFDEMTGQNAPVETRFWLAYDEKYIYFAAKMADPDPKSVKATAFQTNVSLTGDDSITLNLDPVGDLADWNAFGMNARGATNVHVAGGRAAKREWLGEFVAKGRITAAGWEVEARIPWAIMSLPAAGTRTPRITVIRYYARGDRYFDWCTKPGDTNEKMGKWENVVVPKIEARRTLMLLPFGYLGVSDGRAVTCPHFEVHLLIRRLLL